jgi:hypothetical protein
VQQKASAFIKKMMSRRGPGSQTRASPRQLLDMPNKVLHLIAAAADKQDLPNMRLVCSRMFEVTDERFAETFFSHRTHVVSKESISALSKISRNPVLLRHMKSITVNTLCSDRNKHFIESGLFEAVMRQTFINLKRNKTTLDISVMADRTTNPGYGYYELVRAPTIPTEFWMDEIFQQTMTALTKSGCKFRDISVVIGSELEQKEYTKLLTYMEEHDQFLSSGRSFEISDSTSQLHYHIKWEHTDGNSMHVVGANMWRAWPWHQALFGMPTLAAANHFKHTAVNHITLEKTNICDVQWLADSNLRTHFSNITSLELNEVTLLQASGAASTFFKELVKMPNLTNFDMNKVKIVGCRNNMAYLVEMNKTSFEGHDISERLKQLGFALEVDLDVWTQQEDVYRSRRWKCTTVGMWRNDIEVEDIEAFIWYTRAHQGLL